MLKKSDDSNSDINEHEFTLKQLTKKEEHLLELEKLSDKKQKELKKRISEAQEKEKLAVQNEVKSLEHRKQINELIDDLRKEKEELTEQTREKKLLFHNVAEIWHKHFERLMQVKADISREVQHVSKLIESDLHLLYEKEHKLSHDIESINKEKEDITKNKEQLAKVKILEEALKKQEEHFKKEQQAVIEVKKIMKKNKLSKEKAMPFLKKPIINAKKALLNSEEKSNIDELIKSAQQALDFRDLAKAEQEIKNAEKIVKKETNQDKRTEYEFELKELKTNLKIARLA